MFERFTERARQVVTLSQDAARQLRHNHIGTDHILLGLIREEDGLAARVLTKLGYTEYEILRYVDKGTQDVHSQFQQIPFTANARKAFELALREALSLGHNYIGTEHLLLGLIHDEHLLSQFDLNTKEIRDEVIRQLTGPAGRNEQERVKRSAQHKTEEENSKESSQQGSESNPEKVRVTITYGGSTLSVEGDTSGLASTLIKNFIDSIFQK